MFKRLLSLGIASAAVFCGTLWGAKPLSDGENCIPTKVDQEAQTMTVCAPTAYDPVDNEGARLYQVKWDKSTKFYMIRGVKPKSLAPWSDAAVIVSAKMYDETLAKLALYEKIATSERQIAAGRGKNARRSLAAIREKYHV